MPRFLLACVMAALAASLGTAPWLASRLHSQSHSGTAQADEHAPPSSDELRTRAKELLSNQHANDRALEQYERLEHQMERTAGSNPTITDDKLFRVVPTGFGTFKILMKVDGKDVDKDEYRKQLKRWADALQLTLNPSDARTRELQEKYEKKQRDRAEFVDAMKEAFTPHWIGRETKGGHDCDVLTLDPNPDFRPRSMLQGALQHVRIKIWVDHQANQLVYGEATVISDISIGGGIFGKLYRGGVFSLEQQQFTPDVWLPVRMQYDYTVRKFLFTSEEHELIEASNYRHLGTPKEALAEVQAEIAKSATGRGDP
ncbi:MAG TPA: hypothetical protein VMU43_11805 [Candidatus Acidoferrum sp.]|nr:hypothetical protein [Candidatus Acidoferrum sp.]